MGNTSNSGADCQSAVGTIYLLTCTLNGKQYVGQTRQKLGRRISQHKSDSKKKRATGIAAAIRNHGLENFTVEVLETCPVDKLNEREKFWIRELNTRTPNGYNLTDGGDGNSNPSEETRKKISENHADVSGENNPNYGKECSPETREKIAAAHRGKPSPRKGVKLSPETKEKIAAAHRGKPSPRKGKKHTPESIAKMSESKKGKPSPLKGKPLSPETRQKLSDALKAAWARRKKALENGGGK